MDYNEDREVTFSESVNNEEKHPNMMSQILESDNDPSAAIYLNTIGNTSTLHTSLQKFVDFFFLN